MVAKGNNPFAAGKTDTGKVLVWLRERLRKQGVPSHVYSNVGESEGFLLVPVYISRRVELTDSVKLLMKIEDQWNRRKDRGHLKLFLNPASPPAVMRRGNGLARSHPKPRNLKSSNGNGIH